MLVTKQFYCLFPLVCVVSHMIMFSMVRAPPLMDRSDPSDWLTLRLGPPSGKIDDGLQNSINPSASSSHHQSLDQVENGLEHMMGNPTTKEEVLALVKQIQLLKPESSSLYSLGLSYEKYPMNDFGDRGREILEEFIEKFESPSPVQAKELEVIIPLFYIGRDAYFLSSRDGTSFQVFSKIQQKQKVNVFGNIKPGLIPENIQNWGRRNKYL